MAAPPRLDLENTWVVSDTHFGHENIKAYCHRPPDIEQTMMENWARAVPEDATVLHLGDLAWKNNGVFKNLIAPHLTGGRKLLIQGNHDRSRPSFYRQSGFKMVKPFSITLPLEDWPAPPPGQGRPVQPWRISFSHYPLTGEAARAIMREPRVHLHGHIHNNGYGSRDTYLIPFVPGQINLSAEQTKYTPLNLAALLRAYLYGQYTAYEAKPDARELIEAAEAQAETTHAPE